MMGKIGSEVKIKLNQDFSLAETSDDISSGIINLIIPPDNMWEEMLKKYPGAHENGHKREQMVSAVSEQLEPLVEKIKDQGGDPALDFAGKWELLKFDKKLATKLGVKIDEMKEYKIGM